MPQGRLGLGMGEEVECRDRADHRCGVGDRGVVGDQKMQTARGCHAHHRQTVQPIALDHVLDRDVERIVALTVPISALGFLVGALSWRMHTARALERLTMQLQDCEPTDSTLRELLSKAVKDPTLELRYYGDEEVPWRDGNGQPATLPGADVDRCVIVLPDAVPPMAALLVDGAFRDQTHFVHALGARAFTALKRGQLTSALQTTVDDLAASRARLVHAGDSERRRIQRDLHDGLQQRLVMLRIRLGTAAEAAEEESRDENVCPPTLAALGDEVDAIIDDLRVVMRTIYPSLLIDAGVVEALSAAAMRAPLAVSVEAAGLGRYPAKIESAVYFCCLEALQNAVKHGICAKHVTIRIIDDGWLRFEVSDDGVGFKPAGPGGAGLTNMRDRIEVVDGVFAGNPNRALAPGCTAPSR